MNEVTEKKPSKWKMGCLIAVGVIVGLVVIGSLVPEPSPEEQAAREAEQAQTDGAERESELAQATPVTARDLAAAFDANEVAAQQSYGDRHLLVTGEVTGITLDFADNPVIQMAGVNQFLNVQVNLDDADQAAQVSKGQSLTVLCRELTEVISAPILDDCELIE